jgi:pentafunctional AROM polypeptide
VSPNHEEEKVAKDSSKHKNIILIGMRGTGKTQAGRLLSRVLSRQFLDLDEFLESQLGKSIPEIIKESGWEYFREQEALHLIKALVMYPDNTIIASGGGIVESVGSRELLQKIAANGSCHVIHIKRAEFQQVVDYLAKDETRPLYGEDLYAAWQRRKPLYESCCSSEFVIVKNDDEPWSGVDRDLIQFVQFITGSSVTPVADPSFFLSLTFSNLDDLSVDMVSEIVQGVSVVELRVDLLERMDVDFVSSQIFRLRRLLGAVEGAPLPIIFTVRSVSQAGRFPDSQLKEMFDLLLLGIRCGILHAV